MREVRVYTCQPLSSGEDVILDPMASRHLTVLRLKPGSQITLFNGNGGEYAARLTETGSKTHRLAVGEFDDRKTESPLATHMGIGISRGDRMDMVVQKATELGIQKITPLYTERTEVKLKGDRVDKKMRHWQQIVISACEQCGRNTLPELAQPQPLQDWLDSPAGLKFVLHHRSEKSLNSYTETPDSIALLVGPEGGLSKQEIDAAQQAGFKPLTLGPRVMRTETAPLAAISIFQFLWGDMG
ncbi:MAG: 16S rRNA (uracil(1498)-N(3))-methyltransferase [Porticoccaceae bacterium]|nr:16S rRNA (uracil(1498)-N(3))-methyltransferase [Pseudomonadales bacterium]MCP5173076.1 16S rRNA (uracil(1498)-N(3))-methyltransferase [Pseudomonadales bacterium]MCP5302550.1 16S rRNA (uracil(1498)-N(3))-methyltransferase [Pseudomonadales bacterium]